MSSEYDGPILKKDKFLIYLNEGLFSKNILIVKDNKEYFYLNEGALTQADKNSINLSKFKRLSNYYFSKSQLQILKDTFNDDFFINFSYHKTFLLQNSIDGNIVFYDGIYRHLFNHLGEEYNNKWTEIKNNFSLLFFKDIDNKDLLSIDFLLPEVQKKFKKNLSEDNFNFLLDSNNMEIINDLRHSTQRIKDKATEEIKPDKMTYSECSFKENFFLSKYLRVDLLNVASIRYNDHGGYTYFYLKNTDKYFEFSSTEAIFNIISDYYIDFILQERKQDDF